MDSTSTGRVRHTGLVALLLVMAAFHFLLLFYDGSHPQAFLTGDRGSERLTEIQQLHAILGSPNLVRDFLVRHGYAGDYLYQGVGLIVLGRMGLIVFQIVFSMLAMASLYHMAFLLTNSRRVALIAMLSLAVQPSSIIYPHQLVSESLFVPLIAISQYFLARYALGPGRWRDTAISGLLVGLAITIRPVALLWPLVVVGLWALWRHRAPRPLPRFAYLGTAFAPILAWVLFLWMATGSPSLGESEHDLNHNLYERVKLMALSLPEDQQRHVSASHLRTLPGKPGAISLVHYLGFVCEYPGSYIRYLGHDLAVYVAKSEVSRVLLDYVPSVMNVPPDVKAFWRRHWETDGLSGYLAYLWRTCPGFVLANVLGTSLLLLFEGIAVFGLFLALRSPGVGPAGPRRLVTTLCAAYFVYGFLAGQVAYNVPARYRAPGEFAVALFFGVGVVGLTREGIRSPWRRRKEAAV